MKSWTLGTLITEERKKNTKVNLYNVNKINIVNKAWKNKTIDLWHAWLMHVSYHKLNIIINSCTLSCLPNSISMKIPFVSGVNLVWHINFLYEDSKFRVKEPFDLIHSCVRSNKININQWDGYTVTFTNVLSRFAWVYFFKQK